MTTAHRPTWKAAVGKASEGGWTAGGSVSTGRSALDAAAHTQLKLRSKAVDKKAALQESLLKLEEAESKHSLLPKRTILPAIEAEGRQKLLKQTAEVDEDKVRAKYDDADDGGNDDDDSDAWSDLDRGGGGGGGINEESHLDASDSESSDDDDDDEDDEEALQAELAKIRAEREAVKAKEQAEAAAEEDARLEEAALMGNPLLSSSTDGAALSGKLKRRWNDDVVFRNQAKGEPELKKRFINDTVRNDFHKRFLNKFVK